MWKRKPLRRQPRYSRPAKGTDATMAMPSMWSWDSFTSDIAGCATTKDLTSCTTACRGTFRDRKDIAYEAARFAKSQHLAEIIEIVDRSTGVKLIMLEDGRTS